MDAIFNSSLAAGTLVILFLALLVACAFEFINGFHDTANAVATVIYTKSLKPVPSVVWSGIWNFIGVFMGGIAVAIGIINLLPVDLLVASGVGAGLSMVMALLLSAAIWNLGTWYFGIPASSSHTLIGAILGVGIANSMLPGNVFGSGVNWNKAGEIGLSLLVSPLVGFSLAAGLLLLAKIVLDKNPELFKAPEGETPPPFWVRALLILTCTGVSFAHGSNDGQKGVGLIMLILIGILPASFALNLDSTPAQTAEAVLAAEQIELMLQDNSQTFVQPVSTGAQNLSVVALIQKELSEVRGYLKGISSLRDLPEDKRFEVRKRILLADNQLSKLQKEEKLKLSPESATLLKTYRAQLRSMTDYAPVWVLVAVALSLGIGTMVGWKRIVVTVGEKIGKAHLTYAQGAAAELVAASTIGIAATSGLPVSTTHVLSSGVAGTMVAQKSGVQLDIVKKIALAWVLTLPVCVVLSGGLFLLFRMIAG